MDIPIISIFNLNFSFQLNLLIDPLQILIKMYRLLSSTLKPTLKALTDRAIFIHLQKFFLFKQIIKDNPTVKNKITTVLFFIIIKH